MHQFQICCLCKIQLSYKSWRFLGAESRWQNLMRYIMHLLLIMLGIHWGTPSSRTFQVSASRLLNPPHILYLFLLILCWSRGWWPNFCPVCAPHHWILKVQLAQRVETDQRVFTGPNERQTKPAQTQGKLRGDVPGYGMLRTLDSTWKDPLW